jgi:tetratricopeptide (TPR) repeat protein
MHERPGCYARGKPAKEKLDINKILWQTLRAIRVPPERPDQPKGTPMLRVLSPGLLLVPCLFLACLCYSQTGTTPPTADLTSPSSSFAAAAAAAASSTKLAANSTEVGGPVTPSSLKAAFLPVSGLRDALSLYRRGKLDAAVEQYRHILDTDPSSPEAHAGLARIYLKQGKVNLASETVSHGLKVSNSSDLRVALGEIYFRQGKIPEAEQEWLSVVNSGNANGRAYLGLARVRIALSQHDQAITMIEKARELDSFDPDIELNWNMTLPLAERIRHLESYLASPDSAGADDRADSEHYLDYLKVLNRSSQRTCHLANPLPSAEMPLVRLMADSEHLRGYGLTVKIDDRKTVLMLDTGANGILVSRKVAEKAGILKAAESRIAGVGDNGAGDNGAGSGYMGVASAIKIGDLEFQDCLVRVLDKSSVLEDDGLIGTDVFEQFLVNLDFPNGKLRLNEIPPGANDTDSAAPGTILQNSYTAQEMRFYTKVYRFGHYLLVPTRVAAGRSKLFLLDTGGAASEITPAAAREITKLRAEPDKVVIGVSGSVNRLFSAGRAILEFGHVRQENQDLMAFDLTAASQSVGTEISGTLGFDALRRLNIKIDYRDGLVDFEPERANNKQ